MYNINKNEESYTLRQAPSAKNAPGGADKRIRS